MKIKKDNIFGIIEQLDAIIGTMIEDEERLKETIENVHPYHEKSAQNLINYISFRSFDVRAMQKQLKNLGLTRFAHAEGHIKASVLTIRYLLGLAVEENQKDALKKQWSIKKGEKLLKSNTKNLLGIAGKDRRVRIMVTQPKEAAEDYQMVKRMLEKGMDCARINCAHDSPEVWSKIILNIKKAARELDKEVKIAMDLAGPKIRTGKILPGPQVLRCKPKKDNFGKAIEPGKLVLVSESEYVYSPDVLPIKSGDLKTLKVDQVLSLVDARSKRRQLIVTNCTGEKVEVETMQTIYFEPDLILIGTSNEMLELIVGDIPPKENALTLKTGDEIWIHKEHELGRPAELSGDGQMTKPATISCQMPEVFEYIHEGDRIFFDDGKIAGTITEVSETLFKVKITLAKENGSKLRAEKGINFPDTRLGFSGLTAKDKEDLVFVAKNADIVNFSFVNGPEDVEQLYTELDKLGASEKLGVILKIETQFGFENLVSILLEAMKTENIGVMIARGDLAIETGWENIGQIQWEMLSICGAAHVPVIWATQVLENLAKSGLPSRSEITDATTALKAECVMLNKGPYITEAISLLNAILSKMESSQHKNESMLPKLGTVQI
ncbi:pyruvate kinase [Ulvibacterium marinum]|uniref:pyruvate kinase n=1 Tax=Ulvibacterium marinum TaxID=2419782 RepID=UPI0024940B77|nr:pyruvate kinase [Ulvibacterium marinum]